MAFKIGDVVTVKCPRVFNGVATIVESGASEQHWIVKHNDGGKRSYHQSWFVRNKDCICIDLLGARNRACPYGSHSLG